MNSPEALWKAILKEGAAMVKIDSNPGAAVEVGVHRILQCKQAAEMGLETHCVEPSPKSAQRIFRGLANLDQAVRDRIKFYHAAASDDSNQTVPFTASGGTGDHVGSANMWQMKMNSEKVEDGYHMVKVPTVRLDDIVNSTTNDSIFLLKVDTQGYEPAVFSGLTESLASHKVKFILTEFWPRGMDLLRGVPEQCVGGRLLEDLAQAGYTLYALPVLGHPKAPQGYQTLDLENDRPHDDLNDFCRWHLQLEDRFPSKDYKMGYWTDILAVAPGQHIQRPITEVGKLLQGTPRVKCPTCQ